MSINELLVSYEASSRAPIATNAQDTLYKITVGLKPEIVTVVQLSTAFQYPFILVSIYCDEPSAKAWIADIAANVVKLKAKVGKSAQQVSATLMVRVSDGMNARRMPQ